MTTNARTGYEHLTTAALIKAYDRTNAGMVAEFAARDTTPAQRAAVATACSATYDGPLSSAGYVRNGGTNLGGNTKPASTGRKASAAKRAPKMTKIIESATEPTRHGRPINPAKPITRGRVIGEGFYTYDDTVARVKISRSSGKPYAVVLDAVTGEWVYTPGVVKNLSSDDVVSYEIAAAFGRRTGRCMMCGRTLTNPESIDAGIGPICGGRLSGTNDAPLPPYIGADRSINPAPRTNAEIETSTVADNTNRVEDFDPAFDTAVRAVDGLIRAARNHPVNPADVQSWVDIRNMVVAEIGVSDRTNRMRDIITALTKWVADLDDMETRRNADDAAVAALTLDGPVMVNGRLSHAACTHPRTTAARTACRKAFNG